MKAIKLLLVILASLIVVACGGGGDNPPPATTLSGTAAVGAPIVGAAVNVTCAAGAALSNIPSTSATGAWSVTLSGQTLPCAVQVTGGTVNGVANTTAYQSIATSLGTVNVTPLTSLLIANLAGTATPNTWFANLTPTQLAAITSTKVSASLTNLRKALSLTALNSIDPITLPFNPAPGVAMDDILSALGTAMASNPALSYANLLTSAGASAGAAITPPAGLNTALATAYISATSINLSGVTANGVAVGGKLIAPVSMGTHTYYYWDVNGDGTSADIGSLTGADYVLHDQLDQMFNGGTLGDNTKDTTDAGGNIVTLSNGKRIHLLTQAELSALYTAKGVPADWSAVGIPYYASATQASLGNHYGVNFVDGTASSGGDNGAPSRVAFEVLPPDTTTGTAAQYFSKKAVGNTWTWIGSGQNYSSSKVMTVTASAGGVATITDTYTSGGTTYPTDTGTLQLNAAGAWTATFGTYTVTLLPATFSVGTTWVSKPGNTTGNSPTTSTIAAFNVTRTVPAGTFTDCLQINETSTYTNAGVTTISNSTTYYSPTAGTWIETIHVGGSTTQLQTYGTVQVNGTAAQYFSKKAVGNTWTWFDTSSNSTTSSSRAFTVTASTGGVVTVSTTKTSNGTASPPGAGTLRFDATGAWVFSSGTYSTVILPATFSVGTTWVAEPADSAAGTSAMTNTVKAFNVIRTVPAGTFTDCVQVDSTFTHTQQQGGFITTYNSTRFYSPKAGLYVDGFSSDSNGSTGTEQLQAGYIANP